MGKGMGCVFSDLKRRPKKENPPQPSQDDNVESREVSPDIIMRVSQENAASSLQVDTPPYKHKVYIIYYSMYGHIEALAKKIKEGVDSVDGVEAHLFRVAETLAPEILVKMHAPPKDETIPIISASELPAADAFIFGIPTRYGAMAAQMKAFFDSTGSLWQGQKLAGKPAGIFVSTGSQGGGQETTAWTSITQLAHHGMLFVPIGYTFGAGMFKMDEIRGGSPYGAGTYAGDGSRKPSEIELALAEHQGKYTANVVKQLLSS